MIKRILVFGFLFLLSCPLMALEWIPPKTVFKPFLADLTYPSYNTRYTSIVGRKNRAEVNFGDYFAIVGNDMESGNRIQFGILGGAAARFNISRETNDLEVADYSLAFPIDYKVDKLVFRLMYWHTSSHLGDDYIKSNNLAASTLKKHVTDEVRAYVDYNMSERLRFYTGFSRAFNLRPDTSKKNRFHAGLEGKIIKNSNEIFCAWDFQSLQRLGWQPSFTSRMGIRHKNEKNAISAFVQFFSGHLTYLGLMQNKETQWSLGFSYEM
jgi:Protein of unknown function (DUF1207)